MDRSEPVLKRSKRYAGSRPDQCVNGVNGSVIEKGASAMGLFDGKKGLILGVANDHSIAWAVAQQIMAEGGTCGFSHLPDRPDDERQGIDEG